MFRAHPVLTSAVVLAAALALSFAPGGGCAAAPGLQATSTEESAPEWIASKCDSVCGLDDATLLSNPALVRYGSLVDQTPEAKRIRDEHIDPRSAAGIQLLQLAADRVRDACELVRVEQRHCSIWKRIRHRDGRLVPDVTALVEPRLVPPKE
ncbi:MAG: hypothetical protein U1F29_03145 [Planctomycetota bacterium]